MACLAELVLVLIFFEKCQLVSTSLQPGVGDGSAWRWGHKPGSRTLVLGGLGAPPRPQGRFVEAQRFSKRPGKRLGQQSPLKSMTAQPRLGQLEGGGDQFLLTDDHVARLVLSAF